MLRCRTADRHGAGDTMLRAQLASSSVSGDFRAASTSSWRQLGTPCKLIFLKVRGKMGQVLWGLCEPLGSVAIPRLLANSLFSVSPYRSSLHLNLLSPSLPSQCVFRFWLYCLSRSCRAPVQTFPSNCNCTVSTPPLCLPLMCPLWRPRETWEGGTVRCTEQI